VASGTWWRQWWALGGGGWTAPAAATAADRDGRRFRSEGWYWAPVEMIGCD
jgi:hypothetical protein